MEQQLPSLQETIRAWDVAVLGLARAEGTALPPGGTVLRSPADPAVIDALERRLRVRLPPSYRAFLTLSDGAHALPGRGVVCSHELPDRPGHGPGLLGCDGVAWLRDTDRVTIDIWTDPANQMPSRGGHPAFAAPEGEDDYLAHRPGADSMKSGHLLYALRISGELDGDTVLLNPLVVDLDGEWEAWRFGPKNPGAMRYRSLSALLADDADRMTRWSQERAATQVAARPPGADPDFERLARIAADKTLATDERLAACRTMVHTGQGARVEAALIELAGASQSSQSRGQALQMLGYLESAIARNTLLAASEESTSDWYVRGSLAAALSTSGTPDTLRAAVGILSRADLDDMSLQFVPPDGREAVWVAWQATGDPRLLAHCAKCGDERALAPLAEMIRAGRLPQHVLAVTGLDQIAGGAAAVPVLLLAAEHDAASLDLIGEALDRAGATTDAVAVFARAVREQHSAISAQRLGWVDDPDVGHVLLALLDQAPNPAVARALGWFPVPGAEQALLRAAAVEDLHVAAIDGLERLPTDAASEVLAFLAADDDVLAIRALARRQDGRALAPLLRLLTSPTDEEVLAGADGLRDLRGREAAQPLLHVVLATSDDEIAAVAAHALVSMEAPETAIAIDHLRKNGGPLLREIAANWTA